MKRRTKIVCTLGPATSTKEQISNLVRAGMNVARINCSHGDWEMKRQWVQWLREVSPSFAPLAILADLQGPKFRVGEFAGGFIEVKPGQVLSLSQSPTDEITVPGDAIFEAMAVGDRLLMGDGDVELKLVSRTGGRFDAKAISGGKLKSKQGVTLVGKSFEVPSLTEKDLDDVFEACKANVDYIALSYVRRAADIRELRRLVDQYDPTIRLCAKIETKAAVRDIDEILQVSDIIMVARGDLGLQMDMEEVPIAQKHIIRRASKVGKPVITATQMLESMIQNARPTRAESTDVANAILDGTDAVMLSGETAAGAYPIEAVRTMARIAEKAETIFDYESRMRAFDWSAKGTAVPTEAVANAAVELATMIRAKAIVTTSTSGQTPRMVSKFRPKCPIFCASWNARTQSQNAIVWGVETIQLEPGATTEETTHATINALLKAKKLRLGDTVVVTAGHPSGVAGNTNLILVETVS
jgi:pyruvate kinase